MTEKRTRATAFGDYLKQLREATGRSLRAVAPEVGVSFPHLGRIERGEVRGPPPMPVLSRLAAVYGRPVEEVFERAGIQLEPVKPDEFPTGEEQFRRAMLSEDYKPSRLKEEFLAFFPPAFRPLVLEFGANVERRTVERMEWVNQHEPNEPCPIRTYAEVIGAATVKVVVDGSWEETE